MLGLCVDRLIASVWQKACFLMVAVAVFVIARVGLVCGAANHVHSVTSRCAHTPRPSPHRVDLVPVLKFFPDTVDRCALQGAVAEAH